jgi:hypothetical protein
MSNTKQSISNKNEIKRSSNAHFITLVYDNWSLIIVLEWKNLLT